ncbi:hypothetical protein ABGV42_01795 [Paenibacillus pabuli]|uniref:hypothetical protein n=1 Tax=Paenibacillus pabuli TaxID=1472 RepID=UPI003242E1EE
MNLDWIVTYSDDNRSYEDAYGSMQLAEEYAEEAKERGYKDVKWKYRHSGKVLTWGNGKEWGEIEHPDLGFVMTYWKKGTPCYDTYTAPIVDDYGDITCERFCQDEAEWVDTISLGPHADGVVVNFG